MMCFNLPQRMINIAKLACVISVVSVAFSSCLQKDVYDPANSGDKEEVTLDNYFDFATTKNIQLNKSERSPQRKQTLNDPRK